MQDKRSTVNAMYIAKALGRKGYATEGTVEDENAYLRELQERAAQLNQPLQPQQPAAQPANLTDMLRQSREKLQSFSPFRIGEAAVQGGSEGVQHYMNRPYGYTEQERQNYPRFTAATEEYVPYAQRAVRQVMYPFHAIVPGVQAGVTQGVQQFGGDPDLARQIGREAGAMTEWGMSRGDIVSPRAPRNTDAIPRGGEVLPLAREVRQALPGREPVIIDQAREVMRAERPAPPEPIRQIEAVREAQPEVRPVEEAPREVRPAEEARAVEPVAEERPPVERDLTPDELATELADLEPRSLEEIYGLKERGGNWMDRRHFTPEDQAIFNSVNFDPNATYSNEYFEERSLHPASPTAVLRNFKKNLGFDIAQVNPDGTIPLAPEGGVPDYIGKWIDTKLNKYVRNELGTVDDPVFKLADQGILHIPPDNLAGIFHNQFGDLANKEVRGDTRMGRSWDMAAKGNIVSGRAKIYGEQHGAVNPWIEKVPPNTMIYGLRSNALDNLGFGHLVDELRAATDPNSGLPRELRLDPSKLDRVTVPQAVQLVDKINKWRAEQASATKVQQANNAAAVPVRQYPDGFRWVEITEPPEGTPLPAAYRIIPEDGKYKLVTNYEQSGSLKTYDTLGRFDTPEEATKHAVLRDALKGEGDVMGHCVGSSPTYCKGIKSGSTKIYSLRDANGEPHVTIEARQPFRSTQAELNISEDRAREEANQRDFPDTVWGRRERDEFVYRRAYEIRQELAAERSNNSPLTIEQIKGKQNRAPKEQYIPYVQDFIMNNQWDEVNELSNAGLYYRDQLEHTPPYSMKDVSKDARRRALAAANEAGEIPQYVTMQQWEDILKKYLKPEEYEPRRAGGRISDHFHNDDIVPRGFYANGGFTDVIDLETKVPERKWYEPFDLETQAPNVGPWREEPAPAFGKSEPYVEREYIPYTPVEEPAPRPVPSPMAYAPPEPSKVGNNALAAIRRVAPQQEPSEMPVVAATGSAPIFRDMSRMSFDYGNRSRQFTADPSAIVFHHTAGRGNPEGVMAALNAQKFGVHYIIDRDGRIHQSLPLNQYGIHTGVSTIPGVDNRTTLGVEIIAHNDQDVTPAQIEASKRLYSYLQGQYPKMQAYGHGELSLNRLPDEGYQAVMAIRGPEGKWNPSGGRQMPNVPVNKRTLGAYRTGEFASGGRTYPIREHTDWEESLDYEKSGGKLTHMSPDEYLSRVKSLPMSSEDRKTIDHFKKQIKSGVKLDPVAIERGGDANGRHRAHAAKELGVKSIPVMTWAGKKGGGTVVKQALMIVSTKAKRRRGRPD